MLIRKQCFCISIISGEGSEATQALYYVMAENATQALAIVRGRGIELGTNFNLFIVDEVAGFIEPELVEGESEDSTSDASEIKLGTVGSVKMHAGHLMLFMVESEKDVLRNVTPDVVEVNSTWSTESALIF